MGIVVKPNTFSSGATINDTQINADFDTLYNEFNGNIDDANIKAGANIDAAKLLASSITTGRLADNVVTDSKIDYTSSKILRIGPNISGNGLRMARGSKAWNLVGATTANVTVIFSTDSDDGDPIFSATPRIVIGLRLDIGSSQYYGVLIRSVSLTQFVFSINTAIASTTNGFVDWLAIGAA